MGGLLLLLRGLHDRPMGRNGRMQLGPPFAPRVLPLLVLLLLLVLALRPPQHAGAAAPHPPRLTRAASASSHTPPAPVLP